MAPRLRSTRIASPLVLLAFAAAVAAADEPKDTPKPSARVTVEKDGSKTHVVVEQDVSVKLEIKQKPTAACAATAEFEYQQRDTVAHVTGAIENTQCAASSGDYVLAVTFHDAKGELTTVEFPQEWARSDAEPVKFTHDLPIGPNVDLQNVRTRRLRCTCTEPPPAK
jgi:hypothetical protein